MNIQLIYLFFFLFPALSSAFYIANVSLTVDEEEPARVITNLRTTADLDRQFGSRQPLLFQMSTDDPYLAVDAESGDLRIVNRIDLESLCNVRSKCLSGGVHRFSVSVKNSGQSKVAQIDVTLHVTDINDNAPQFGATYEEIKKDESICTHIQYSCPNRKIDLPTAKDNDFSAQFNQLTYSLAPGSLSDGVQDTFELKFDDYGAPYLYLIQALDAERKEYYQFDFVAKDKTGLFGKINIKIIVNDDNDNSPKFTQKEYTVTVPEDKTKGSTIYKLVATDLDLRHNLEYSMDPGSSDIAKTYFDVLTDGSIIIKTPLDYESQKEYQFRVKVNDGRFTEKATVNVRVLDVNDHRPDYSTSGELKVMEGEAAGKLVASVKVFDKDSDDMGRVTCEPIVGSDLEFRKSPLPNTFDLLTRRVFDREREQFITGTLQCRDHGTPSLSSTFTATVMVGDLNDNSPYFVVSKSTGYIEAQIEENMPAETKVTTLRALDDDIGENARLEYRFSIRSQHTELFTLGMSDGVLRTTRKFDREARDIYLLHVEVRDAGEPQLTGSATVRVTVTDVNDEPPIFTGPTGFTVTENREPPVFLGTLTATDRDLGINGKVYFVQESSAFYTLFNVEKNGSVYALQSFDRERQSEYNIPVRISDGAIMPNQLYVRTSILIKILDVNDNAPKVIQPGNDTIRISIHTHPPGALITRVLAEDPDEGDNGRVTYSLEVGSGKFRIETDSGALKVNTRLGVSDLKMHKLLVKVTDMAADSVRQSEVKVLYILVDDSAPPLDPLDDAALAAAHTRRNVLIIIVLASVSAVLAVILIAAIICVNRPCCDPRRHQRRMKRAPPPEDGFSEQAMHLTVQEPDLTWGTTIDRRQCGSPYSPFVTSTMTSPSHEMYNSLERQRFQNTTLPNPKQVKVTNGTGKPGKNDQVNYWLYQIKEDSAPQVAQQNYCTIARSPPQNHHHDPATDGAQSDSGRGCSDEDLTAAGGAQLPTCQVHKNTPNLGNRVLSSIEKGIPGFGGVWGWGLLALSSLFRPLSSLPRLRGLSGWGVPRVLH